MLPNSNEAKLFCSYYVIWLSLLPQSCVRLIPSVQWKKGLKHRKGNWLTTGKEASWHPQKNYFFGWGLPLFCTVSQIGSFLCEPQATEANWKETHVLLLLQSQGWWYLPEGSPGQNRTASFVLQAWTHPQTRPDTGLTARFYLAFLKAFIIFSGHWAAGGAKHGLPPFFFWEILFHSQKKFRVLELSRSRIVGVFFMIQRHWQKKQQRSKKQR